MHPDRLSSHVHKLFWRPEMPCTASAGLRKALLAPSEAFLRPTEDSAGLQTHLNGDQRTSPVVSRVLWTGLTDLFYPGGGVVICEHISMDTKVELYFYDYNIKVDSLYSVQIIIMAGVSPLQNETNFPKDSSRIFLLQITLQFHIQRKHQKWIFGPNFTFKYVKSLSKSPNDSQCSSRAVTLCCTALPIFAELLFFVHCLINPCDSELTFRLLHYSWAII